LGIGLESISGASERRSGASGALLKHTQEKTHMMVPKWMERQQAWAEATGQKYVDLLDALDEVTSWWFDEPGGWFKLKAARSKRS